MTEIMTGSVTLAILAEDWQRSLTVKNMSPKTIKTYMEAVTGLDRFLASKGMPRSADAIKREHVEAFVNDLLERWGYPLPPTGASRVASYLLGLAATAVGAPDRPASSPLVSAVVPVRAPGCRRPPCRVHEQPLDWTVAGSRTPSSRRGC
jgi:hypothetical protein